MSTINLEIEYSSLGETTEQEAGFFIDELKDAIQKEFPEASVSVSLDLRGGGEMIVIADDSQEQDEMCLKITDIERKVWERGNWHNK
ncbi:hypothetical protein FNH88_19730 [Salmonella enterica subsp. salamae]|nr:hypothetical protein [Salmonella enterica subsp. salamae]